MHNSKTITSMVGITIGAMGLLLYEIRSGNLKINTKNRNLNIDYKGHKHTIPASALDKYSEKCKQIADHLI